MSELEQAQLLIQKYQKMIKTYAEIVRIMGEMLDSPQKGKE